MLADLPPLGRFDFSFSLRSNKKQRFQILGLRFNLCFLWFYSKFEAGSMLNEVCVLVRVAY